METHCLEDKEGLYLALGGGAARGLAHLGVLKALEEKKVPIRGICGTSMGALVGANYALAPRADSVINDFSAYVNSSHFNRVRYNFMKEAERRNREKAPFRQMLSQGVLLGRSFRMGSIVSFSEYQSEIQALCPNKTFTDLALPFFATGVDLTNTKEVLFNGGFIRSAIMASAAIPGVFPAVQQDQTIYVDGGWMNRIPVNPLLAMGARHVLAVDVSDNPRPEINPRRGWSILNQANRATMIRLSEIQSEHASIFWELPVEHLSWADFAEIEQAVEIGYRFGLEHIDEVWDVLKPAPKPSLWRRWIHGESQDRKKVPITTSFEIREIWDVAEADLNSGNSVKPTETATP